MKRILLILCFFAPYVVLAVAHQDTVININHIPEGGYLLDKGWKFHAGDDMAFARPGYDDHLWQNIHATANIPDLPLAAQQGIGWLRLRIKIAPELNYKTLLQVMQFPGMEFYVDGKLVVKRGIINTGSKTGSGYFDTTPIDWALNADSIHVLAVRYAMPGYIKYINAYGLAPFLSTFITNSKQITNQGKMFEIYRTLLVACIGILLLLAALHLVFLYYNRGKKANLYFAGYAFFFAVFVFCLLSVNKGLNYDKVQFFLFFTGYSLFVISGLFGIKALYALFNFKQARLFSWLCVAALLGVCLETFVTKLNGAFIVDILIINAFQLWLTVKAVYYKKRGAGIIATGFFLGLVGLFAVIGVEAIYNINEIIFWIYFSISMATALLCPAFAISLFLSREFALDSQLLAIKLTQVEQLSAANLAQEQEKQQMMANQNIVLEQQVKERTAELNQSLNELKSTQTQLVQREKMASLGELTAGIAHEIQNPLNFVNNFSDVSRELMEELKEELDKGDTEEAKTIASDVVENLGKINHHGKRADAIVKGMLEHSRVGSGEKQPTDLNVLADEFLKLSYHGLRAKDKTFNAEMVTDFDPGLPKISVIAQDISRVLLNLFNNAFYAVNQKKKTAGVDYKPEVTVSTSAEKPHLVIKVKDNGNGIPDYIKDKIMQPFFTTKPTGEGTGLGLSLSYDIVVKGHGGSIAVNTKEGEGSEFVILLPVN